MAQFFDEAAWREVVQLPDWYIKLYPELRKLSEQSESETDRSKSDTIKQEVRGFFEAGLKNGTIALGEDGPNLDSQRRPIDTIVIHHTSSPPGYTLARMNAVQLLNIYVPYFNNPTDEREKSLKGNALWSNHIRKGRPVFYAYHWLMRMDGSFERLLEDHELGWHAANWNVNRRSVAICLDNDFEDKDPKPELLQKLTDFITGNYSSVSVERIFGHCEVSSKPTVCPGVNFEKGWKQRLMS